MITPTDSVPWEPYGDLIDTRLRLATWNIWWRFGLWEKRQPAIVETLQLIDADVFVLQEVWEDGSVSQAAELAEALGFNFAYHPWRQVKGIQFGNAVLSRWDITASKYRPYTVIDDHTEHRGAIRADIDGPRGPLQVFTTHLNWRIDEGAQRCQQVLELLDFVKTSPPRSYPAVVGGDFNADPSSDEIRMMTGGHRAGETGTTLLDAWEYADHADPGWTWSNNNPNAAAALEPNRRIDYVFTGWPKGGGAGHVRNVRVVEPLLNEGLPASDHSAVVAELRY